MKNEELINYAICWFKQISNDIDMVTSGNFSHNLVSIKGRAIRAYEFLEKYKNEE
jgi:hypothetical protein